jgi:hypothetical protein
VNKDLLKLAEDRAAAMNERAALPDDGHDAEHRRYLDNKIADLTSQLAQHSALLERTVS